MLRRRGDWYHLQLDALAQPGPAPPAALLSACCGCDRDDALEQLYRYSLCHCDVFVDLVRRHGEKPLPPCLCCVRFGEAAARRVGRELAALAAVFSPLEFLRSRAGAAALARETCDLSADAARELADGWGDATVAAARGVFAARPPCAPGRLWIWSTGEGRRAARRAADAAAAAGAPVSLCRLAAAPWPRARVYEMRCDSGRGVEIAAAALAAAAAGEPPPRRRRRAAYSCLAAASASAAASAASASAAASAASAASSDSFTSA